MPDLRTPIQKLYHQSPVLGLTTLLSLILFGAALLAMLLDDRRLLGAPIWLKPAKFGISGAVYLAALMFVVRDLRPTRVTRLATVLIGWLIVLETVLISIQAARGVQSHFNVDTALDAAIFSVMGTAIAVVWLASIVLLVLHARTRVDDRAMAMALRIGLALNILGASVGWVMVQPQPAQLAALTDGRHPLRVGAHTVGAADGGEGLPVTNWSRNAGDLRVAHFVGLHALQLLPLFVLALRVARTRHDDGIERSLLTLVAGASVAMFYSTLLQALAGRPFLPPS